ncbi:hypothetical protein [Streptomyces bluensis]
MLPHCAHARYVWNLAVATSPSTRTTAATSARSPSSPSPGQRWHRACGGDPAIWRKLWSDGEDHACHARGFIAQHLAVSGVRV